MRYLKSKHQLFLASSEALEHPVCNFFLKDEWVAGDLRSVNSHLLECHAPY